LHLRRLGCLLLRLFLGCPKLRYYLNYLLILGYLRCLQCQHYLKHLYFLKLLYCQDYLHCLLTHLLRLRRHCLLQDHRLHFLDYQEIES
jgi:hypothetical protein